MNNLEQNRWNPHSKPWVSAYRLLRDFVKCSEIDKNKLIQLCLEQQDWDLFLHQLHWHRVAGIAWQRFESFQPHVPPPVYQCVRQAIRQTRFTALKHLAALKQIVASFEKNNIRYLTLKGPVLSQQIYNNPYIRRSRDLDIIVDGKDLDEAICLLNQLGYYHEPIDELESEIMKHAFRKLRKDITLTNKKLGIQVELHWRWEANPLMLNLSFEEAWEQRIEVTLNGLCVSTLNPSNNIVYLAMHGAKSNWVRLSWLTDIDRIGSQQTLDEISVIAQAKKTGSHHLLCYAFAMAQQLLETPLPKTIATHSSLDKKVAALTRFGARTNNQCCYPITVIRLFHSLKLNSRWKYRWYFYTHVIGATIRDIKLLPLPKPLFPMYYVLRPVFWLWRNRGNLKRIMQ